jgi:hypothetical protein
MFRMAKPLRLECSSAVDADKSGSKMRGADEI